MKNNYERILPYAMSQKIAEKDLQDISAAGTSSGTTNVTFGVMGTDLEADVTVDL